MEIINVETKRRLILKDAMWGECSITKSKKQVSKGVLNDDFDLAYEDVESYVKYAKSLGFKNIILAGHSLGSNKIINYLSNSPDDYVALRAG